MFFEPGGSIRPKLLKIGALVNASLRRVKIAMASGHPRVWPRVCGAHLSNALKPERRSATKQIESVSPNARSDFRTGGSIRPKLLKIGALIRVCRAHLSNALKPERRSATKQIESVSPNARPETGQATATVSEAGVSNSVPSVDLGSERWLHQNNRPASCHAGVVERRIKSRQPKSFAARFMGQNHPRKMARGRAASLQPFDQCGQFLAACSRNMPCVALDTWKLNGQHPFLLAHLQSADDRGIVIRSGASGRGPFGLCHLDSPR
jgi:hypothetical protein